MHTESDNIKQSGQHLIDAINDKGPESLLAIEAFYRLQGVIMGLNNSDLQIFICAETDRLTSKLAWRWCTCCIAPLHWAPPGAARCWFS